MDLTEAVKIVAKELFEMPYADFHQMLKEHEDGDITRALLQLEDFGCWLATSNNDKQE